MRMTWIALALIISGSSWAQSPNAGGTPAERSPGKVNSSNQAGQVQYQIKDATPPVTNLQSPQDPKTPTERERSAAEENEKANLNDEKSVEGNTLATAWVAGIGAIIATLAMALIFLWRGIQVTRKTADAAREQAKLRREEFLEAHRPKIVIKACGLSGDSVAGGYMWPCKFNYTNIGVSTAYIRKIGTRVWNSTNPWTTADKTIEFNESLSKEALNSGENREFLTDKDFNTDWIETHWFFAGYIEYSDMEEGGTVRKVGFIRRWMGSPGHRLSDHEWGKYSGENEHYEYSP
jgi:hypothetical protein